MKITYPAIGICGLSCRLCPHFHTEGTSRCDGCKTESRIGAGCPFITCALKKKGIGFCGECDECDTCERWARHRRAGRAADSFTCYQKLEENIACIRQSGAGEFERLQRVREAILNGMLQEFNEGRSKSYYCIAATVMEIPELEGALAEARRTCGELAIKEKSRALHALLDAIARDRGYTLKLRK